MNPLARVALLAALPALALAQASTAPARGSLALGGLMGSKAMLVIDGQSQILAVGETARGVRLLSLQGEQATVERDGVRSVLSVGASPVSVAGGSPAAGGREVVIPAGPGGHFITGGSINGRSVRFMVDTGATLVALGRADAERLGVDLREAKPGVSQTANGTVAVLMVTLASVRVGDVELRNVPGVVVPAAMPQVLLGNSFLSRLQMRRDNDVMRLELRP